MDQQQLMAAIAAAAAGLSDTDSAASRRQLALMYQQLPTDERRYLSEASRDEIVKRLRKDNRTCFDCSSRNPTWISLSHGVYICLTCSGRHRQLGTHLSFVRSLEMDKLFAEQLFRMELGGNKRAHEYFREHGADTGQPVDYRGKLATKHRQTLDRLVSAELQSIGWSACSSNVPAATSMSQPVSAVGPVESSRQQQPKPEEISTSSTTVLPASRISAARPCLADNMSWGSISGRGVRTRKLDADFDFDEAALLLSGMQSQTPSYPVGGSADAVSLQSAQKHRQPNSSIVSKEHRLNTSNDRASGSNLGFSSHKASDSHGSGGDAAERSSSRFVGAKSISSSQYFGEDERTAPVAAIPVDPTRRAIGSDEVFGRSSGSHTAWELNGAARVETIRTHAQQGWQQLSQAGSDVISKAREWLAG